MALNLPQRRTNIKQIQIPQRQVPFDQIIATYGQSPKAEAIRQIGNVIGTVMQQRAALRKQGEELAALSRFTGQDYTGLNPEVAQNLALINARQQQSPQNPSSGYYVPRGTDPETGQPIYSNSKVPGLFYADGTQYTGTTPAKLTLQQLPGEQITKEEMISSIRNAANKIEQSYYPEGRGEGARKRSDLVGPAASRIGKTKQYIEGYATPDAATFYQNTEGLRALLIYLRSGKQINEEEYRRLLRTLPNENLSPTDFETRLDNFYDELDSIESTRAASLKGYRQPDLNRPPLKQINKPAEFRWNPQTGKLEKI